MDIWLYTVKQFHLTYTYLCGSGMSITSYDKTASLHLTLHISPLNKQDKNCQFAGGVDKVTDYFEKNYNSVTFILTKQ